MDRELTTSARRRAMALGLVIALLGGGAVGWTLGREDHGPQTPSLTEFEATLDSVEPDALRACVSPLDPKLVERVGASVCGRVFFANGMEPIPSQRVHVEWLTVVVGSDDDSVEALALSPLSR